MKACQNGISFSLKDYKPENTVDFRGSRILLPFYSEMSFLSQLEMYENHPLYKEILKNILKSQIQILVDQLSAKIGEETVILTANLDDGKITDIGTECGRDFLKGHNDIKVNFLGFCMKRFFENQAKGRDTVLRKSKSNAEKSSNNTEAEIHEHSLETVQNRLKVNTNKDDLFNEESMQENEQVSKNRDTLSDMEMSTGYVDTNVKQEELEQDDYSEMNTPMVDMTKDEERRLFPKLEQVDDHDPVNGTAIGRDCEVAVPWLDDRDQSNSLQDQITSKRKQKVPKRKKIEATEPNVNTVDLTTHEAGDSENEYDLSKNDSSSNRVEYLWTTDQISDLSRSPIRTHEDKNGFRPSGFGVISPTGTYTEYSIEESPLRHDFNKYEIQHISYKEGNDLLEEIPRSNRIPDSHGAIQYNSYAINSHHEVCAKTHSPVPQPVDGVLVTRGAGRFEKLLKCELCGKICRTSNMARHKKRYCLGASNKKRKYENIPATEHGCGIANDNIPPLKAL